MRLQAMKYAALSFSYSNGHSFGTRFADEKYYTVNVGDNMQTLAAKHVYRKLGVDDSDIISIDRDTLASYDGPEATLIMNAVFHAWSFPTPPQIHPIFVGFNADEGVISTHQEYFRSHQPIGCRDPRTCRIFEKYGIHAYVTGCLTLCMAEPRTTIPEKTKLVVIYGSYAGTLPATVLKHVPPDLLDTAEFVFQRKPVFSYPVDERERSDLDFYAETLLNRYRDEASVVLTPLHHAATPCMALGIPVIVCRQFADDRFGFLEKLVPVHLPERFGEIDWRPPPVDLSGVRSNLLSLVRSQMRPFLRQAGDAPCG